MVEKRLMRYVNGIRSESEEKIYKTKKIRHAL